MPEQRFRAPKPCVDCGVEHSHRRERCMECAARYRRKPLTPDDPRHGTYTGAKAHERIGEEMCEPCRTARREYQRQLKVAKKSRPCDQCQQPTYAKLCRSCVATKRARERRLMVQNGLTWEGTPWKEEELDPVTDWVMARSPSGHFILRRAS